MGRDNINEDDITCSLTGQIFLDPVKVPIESEKKDKTTALAFATVERQYIEKWIADHGTNPFNRKPLEIKDLISDDEMETNVAAFLEKFPEKKSSQYTLQVLPSNPAPQPRQPVGPTLDDWIAIRSAQGIGGGLPAQVSSYMTMLIHMQVQQGIEAILRQPGFTGRLSRRHAVALIAMAMGFSIAALATAAVLPLATQIPASSALTGPLGFGSLFPRPSRTPLAEARNRQLIEELEQVLEQDSNTRRLSPQ
jgi:hypothetical protein